VQLSYQYDGAGQLTNAQAREPNFGPARLNESIGYAYDAAGNLRRRTNGVTVVDFHADKLNQLTNAVRSASMTVSGSLATNASYVTVNNVGAQVYHDYTFSTTGGVGLADGQNTLTTKAVDGQNFTNTLVTTASLPRSVSLTYDANGNLFNDGLRRFEYDGADRLSAVYVPNAWRSEFVYDGLSRRRVTREKGWQGGTWVQTNETRYVYLGRSVVQERNSAGNPTVTYTRGLDLSGTFGGAGGIGGLLARTDANGAAFYHNDGAGNITTLINSSGQAQARYTYDPLGNLIDKCGSLADANLYRFSSKEHLPNAGLYYYGFRFYDPNLQRWLNRDPLGIAGGLNFYQFARNSPPNLVDPDGRNPLLIAIALLVLFESTGDPPLPEAAVYPPIPMHIAPGAGTIGPLQNGIVAGDFLSGMGGAQFAGTGMEQPMADFTAAAITAPLGLTKIKCPPAAKRATTTFQGMEVRAVRELSHVDDGTLQAMSRRGFAPDTVNGDQIVLHHLNQNPAGPLVELPRANHSIWNSRQHPFGNTPGAGLTAEQRAAFDAWRVEYWKARAQQELTRRAGGQ
jgi:RHS repeat-associated protein